MIEVGEYVRTNTGKIDKVINNNYYMPQYIECEKDIVYKENISKHSKNIIDLIEVGDLVFIEENSNFCDFIYVNDEEMLEAVKEDIITGIAKIKSILTKELYNANCYTVERKE